MIKLNKFLKEETWKAEKSVITLDGKKVGDYSYDRDSDSFWIDNIKGSGQKSFDTTAELLSYIKKNKTDYLKARKDYTSKGYVKEETAPEIVKDLDKVKNDLIKKVDVLIAKKKKLYSNVDMTTPMSPEEKQLDKDIQSIFSQIQQIILKKRTLKKEGISFQQGVVYSNPYHSAFKPQVKEEVIEEATTKLDFSHATPITSGIIFYTSAKEGKIVLIPASTKDVEKVDTIKKELGNGADADFLLLVQIRLEKKLGLKVIPDKRHSGAGYAFEIDMDTLLKKL